MNSERNGKVVTLADHSPTTRAVHLQIDLRAIPVWWRFRLLLGGTLHLLIRRHGAKLEKLAVDGVRCTLGGQK